MKKNYYRDLSLKCCCGCNSQVLLKIDDDNTVFIDVRDSGRHKWHGVALSEKDSKKVKEFFS